MLLSECCVRSGAWLLVPLQGAALGCWCRNAVRVGKKHVSAAHEYLLLSEVFAGVFFKEIYVIMCVCVRVL